MAPFFGGKGLGDDLWPGMHGDMVTFWSMRSVKQREHFITMRAIVNGEGIRSVWYQIKDRVVTPILAGQRERLQSIEDRIVRVDEIRVNGKKRHRISTVFLGLDHGFVRRGDLPVVFETAVFNYTERGAEMETDIEDRYRTWDEALIGHFRIAQDRQAKLEMQRLMTMFQKINALAKKDLRAWHKLRKMLSRQPKPIWRYPGD